MESLSGELLVVPDIRSKASSVSDRLNAALRLAENSFGTSLPLNETVIEFSGEVGINKNFRLTRLGEKIPFAVATLFNTDLQREKFKPLERAVDGLELLNKELPNITNHTIDAEKVLAVDSSNKILIASFEKENVLHTPDLMTSLLSDVCHSLSQIRPTEENLKTFPHLSLNQLTTPVDYMDKTVSGGINPFNEWIHKLSEGNVGGNSLEAADYLKLNSVLQKLKVSERINDSLHKTREHVLKSSNIRFDNPTDQRFHLGDGRHTNFLIESKNGALITHIIDADTSEFGSADFFAAMVACHPGNNEIFGQGKEGEHRRKEFLTRYVELNKLSQEEVKKLNIMIELVNLGWVSRIARNMATNRNNWFVAMGGQYKTKADFLLNEDVPVLDNFLNRDVARFTVDVGADTNFIFSSKPQVLEKAVNPLTQESPIGRHETWVAQKVKDLKKHMNGLNKPLVKHNAAYEFTAKEALGNSPYIIGKTKFVKDVGNGILFAQMKFNSMRSTSSRDKDFGYITRTKEAAAQRGGLLFVMVDEKEVKIDNLNSRKSKKISVSQKVVDEMINDSIDTRNPEYTKRLSVLSQKLKNIGPISDNETPRVEKLTLHKEHNKFFTIVTAEISDGRRIPIKVNRSGELSSEQAVGYVVRTNEGKYRVLLNTRISTPQRDDKKSAKKEQLEGARAFSDGENPFAELSEELGMNKGTYSVNGGFMITQSWESDGVNFPFYFIQEKEGIFVNQGIEDVSKDEGWEELTRVDLSGQEIVSYIQNNEIRDGLTIYSTAVCMLRDTGELRINLEKAAGKKLILKREFILQEGSDRLVIPRGPKDIIGVDLGKAYPNTGSDRIEDNIKSLSWDEYSSNLNSNDSIEVLDVLQVVEGIKSGQFDTPTAVTLIKGLLNEGALEYNNITYNLDK